MAEHLFDNPRTLPQLSDATGIELIAAAGPAGEARAVAERVKRLLLEGVPAEDIVIGTRSLDEEGLDLRSGFAGAGIPSLLRDGHSILANSDRPDAVCRASGGAAGLGVQFALFRAAVKLFSPAMAGRATSKTAVETTIRVLRRYQLGSDRQHILKRLAKLLEKSESNAAELSQGDHKAAGGNPDRASTLASIVRCNQATARIEGPRWLD